MQKLWRFMIRGGGEHHRSRVIIARRFEVFFAVVVGVVEDFHLDLSHSLDLRVVIDRSQREPMIFVIVQLQVTLSYCYFANRSVLLQMAITFQHVYR